MIKRYSEFFQTLYDEHQPVGALGRGSHYSVLRAIVFHDQENLVLKTAKFHDFAIIWDEDHDTRIIKVIEKIYFSGFLSRYKFFGENKGCFTTIRDISIPEGILENLIYTTQIESICDKVEEDVWNYEDAHPWHIINDAEEKVKIYLQNILGLWNLGLKSIK